MNHNSNKNQKPVIEYIARITMPDGEVVEKSASTVGDFPSPEEFDLSTREGFLADFDLLEKAVLETSRKLNRKLSEEFLDSSSKKKRTRKANHIRFRGRSYFLFRIWNARGFLAAKGTRPFPVFFRDCLLYLCKNKLPGCHRYPQPFPGKA